MSFQQWSTYENIWRQVRSLVYNVRSSNRAIQLKRKKYHTVRTVPKAKTPITNIHDDLFSVLVQALQSKELELKNLDCWSQTCSFSEMIRWCKCFKHGSKTLAFKYNLGSNSVFFWFCFLAHLCELLPSLGVRRPSVSFFKNLLLWNHWANLKQTWPESSLGMSNSHALHPRWPPLLKIEISSNGQNCFLSYITGFFMNFELLPIMQIRHK